MNLFAEGFPFGAILLSVFCGLILFWFLYHLESEGSFDFRWRIRYNRWYIARVLTYSRHYIATDQAQYVCYALDAVGNHYDFPKSIIRQAKSYVTSNLEGMICLESWLFKYHNINVNNYPIDERVRLLKQTRIDWLDDMVATLNSY